MLVDGVKINKQKRYNAFSYTTIGLILTYLQESNNDEDIEKDECLPEFKKKENTSSAMIRFTKH